MQLPWSLITPVPPTGGTNVHERPGGLREITTPPEMRLVEPAQYLLPLAVQMLPVTARAFGAVSSRAPIATTSPLSIENNLRMMLFPF
jgi:hypothetical protein